LPATPALGSPYPGTATVGRHVCARGALSQRVLGGNGSYDGGFGLRFWGVGGPTVTKAHSPIERPAVTGGRSRLPAGCSERFAVRPPPRCAPPRGAAPCCLLGTSATKGRRMDSVGCWLIATPTGSHRGYRLLGMLKSEPAGSGPQPGRLGVACLPSRAALRPPTAPWGAKRERWMPPAASPAPPGHPLGAQPAWLSCWLNVPAAL
jgi:hypothetical protein